MILYGVVFLTYFFQFYDLDKNRFWIRELGEKY